MMAFKLQERDLSDPLWLKIKAHLEERRDAHRKANDKSQTADVTEKLRGRIAELLYVLSLGEPEKAPVLHEQEFD